MKLNLNFYSNSKQFLNLRIKFQELISITNLNFLPNLVARVETYKNHSSLVVLSYSVSTTSF